MLRLVAPLALLLVAAPACAPIPLDRLSAAIQTANMSIALARGTVLVVENTGLIPVALGDKLRVALNMAAQLLTLAQDAIAAGDRIKAARLVEQARQEVGRVNELTPDVPASSH